MGKITFEDLMLNIENAIEVADDAHKVALMGGNPAIPISEIREYLQAARSIGKHLQK